MAYSPPLHNSLPLRSRPEGARFWRAADLSLPEETPAELVLASVSPRRRELLRRAGVCFEVLDPGEDPPLPHLAAWPAACLRAAHKAARGARLRPVRVSLGADTVVVYEGHTLGKPADAEEARWMLELLAGRTHEVYTAFSLAVAGGARPGGTPAVRMLWLEVVRTLVTFRALTTSEVAAYVASGAPFDKAGGYGIQDRDYRLVEGIRGSYYNVVGLPVRQVRAALRVLGGPRWECPSRAGAPAVVRYQR